MQKLTFMLSKMVCGLVAVFGTTSMLMGPCLGPAYQPKVPSELKK